MTRTLSTSLRCFLSGGLSKESICMKRLPRWTSHSIKVKMSWSARAVLVSLTKQRFELLSAIDKEMTKCGPKPPQRTSTPSSVAGPFVPQVAVIPPCVFARKEDSSAVALVTSSKSELHASSCLLNETTRAGAGVIQPGHGRNRKRRKKAKKLVFVI